MAYMRGAAVFAVTERQFGMLDTRVKVGAAEADLLVY
jgi:hypothetical protein